PGFVFGAVAVPVDGGVVAAGAPFAEVLHDVDFHALALAGAGVAARPDVEAGGGAAVGHGPEGGPESACNGKFDTCFHVTVGLGPFAVALGYAGGVVAPGAGGVVVVMAAAFLDADGEGAVGDDHVFGNLAVKVAGLKA